MPHLWVASSARTASTTSLIVDPSGSCQYLRGVIWATRLGCYR